MHFPLSLPFVARAGRVSFAVAALLAAVLSGCRRPAPALPPNQAHLAPMEVDAHKDGGWLFTYIDDKGQFATTDKPESIPAASRRMVRVVDPSRGAGDRRDTGEVYVVDARELTAKGKATARPMSRQAFETGALAQLPPGASSLLSERPSGAGDGDERLPDGGAPAAAGDAVVTVYGTSWCSACRAARQYLGQRKIPFVEKDIERDPAAAAELRAKAERLGIPTDRVPILDVRGRLLLGFDPARLDAMLGDAT